MQLLHFFRKKLLILAVCHHSYSPKNAHNPKVLTEYYEPYKTVVDGFGILRLDQYNFDETRFCMGIGCED